MTATDLEGVEEYEVDEEGKQICPLCGFHAKNMGAHMRRHENTSTNGNGRTRARDTFNPDKPVPLSLREEEDRLVESLATVGMFVGPLLPHTGATIVSRAGDREIPIPNGKPIHKAGIASVMIDYGKRDPRVMRAIVRFNALMHGGEAFELAASLAAAVAVDVHVVSPHLQLPIPGVPEDIQPQPIMMLIGDVVQNIEERMAEAQAQGYGPQEAPGATVEAGAEA